MSEPDPRARPGSGEVRPRLDRAPGERYAAAAGQGPTAADGSERSERSRRGPGRTVLAASAVALAGAAVFFVLGLVAIGVGTLAAAAAVGWAVGLTLASGGAMNGARGGPARMAVAGGLAAGAVAVGLLAGWAWARAEGGVLPPLEYLDQRYGVLAWLNVLVAATTGAWRGR